MVYAKDMHQVAMQKITQREAEEQKAHDEKIRKLSERTRQFCHSTLSRMIEDKAYDGQKYIVLYITAPDSDGICSIVEENSSCKRIEYKETIVFNKMEEILKEHAYNLETKYCVYHSKYEYQDKWEDGVQITIKW